MALWGNKDSKTASGTVTITGSTGAVVGSSTSFTTQAKVGNTIRVSGEDYVIVTITDNTHCKVRPGVQGATMTDRSGASYTLSEKPVYVAASEASNVDGYGSAGDITKVFGVDTTEERQAAAKAQGIAHAGWVRRTEGSGNRAGRVFTEVLVAGGSITGDQADDAVLPDRTITITSQPEDFEIAEATAGDIFSVTATVSPTTTLSYNWYVSNDGENWGIISDSNNNFTGQLTDTLGIVDATGYDGNMFRVNVLATGATTVTSSSATLTVTAAP